MLKLGGGPARRGGQQLHERLAALRPEPRQIAVALHAAQPDHALVELGQRVDVRHPQADLADGVCRGESRDRLECVALGPEEPEEDDLRISHPGAQPVDLIDRRAAAGAGRRDVEGR